MIDYLKDIKGWLVIISCQLSFIIGAGLVLIAADIRSFNQTMAPIVKIGGLNNER